LIRRLASVLRAALRTGVPLGEACAGRGCRLTWPSLRRSSPLCQGSCRVQVEGPPLGGTPRGRNRGQEAGLRMRYYSEDFKQAAVAKMAAPGGRSATSLSKELGVSQTSLSQWLREPCSPEQPRSPTRVAAPPRTHLVSRW
jgi:hypothetical protein